MSHLFSPSAEGGFSLSPSARLLSGAQRFNFPRFRILTTHPVTRHYTNRPKFKHLCYNPSCGITLWLPIWLDIVVVPADTCSNLFHSFSSPNAFWLARHSSEITELNANVSSILSPDIGYVHDVQQSVHVQNPFNTNNTTGPSNICSTQHLSTNPQNPGKDSGWCWNEFGQLNEIGPKFIWALEWGKNNNCYLKSLWWEPTFISKIMSNN